MVKEKAINGYVVVNVQSGTPLPCTFASTERMAQALAVEYLAKLGQGQQTWQQWEGHGYKAVPASLKVER